MCSNVQYLYNVMYSLDGSSLSLERKLVPRVPITLRRGEDKNIKRICLSESIEQCMMSIQREFTQGMQIIVRKVDVSTLDKAKLLKPMDVVKYVPDALYTGEYWYLDEVATDVSVYTITNIVNDITVDYISMSLPKLYKELKSYKLSCLPKAVIQPKAQESANTYQLRIRGYVKTNYGADSQEYYELDDVLWEIGMGMSFGRVVSNLELEEVS